MQAFGIICVVVGTIAFCIAYCAQLINSFKKSKKEIKK